MGFNFSVIKQIMLKFDRPIKWPEIVVFLRLKVPQDPNPYKLPAVSNRSNKVYVLVVFISGGVYKAEWT